MLSSFPDAFSPSYNGTDFYNNRPISTTPYNTYKKKVSANTYYISHIYSQMSTVPQQYLYWFSPPSVKTLTVTGESKGQILFRFKNALLHSKLQEACSLGVELHCSGYILDVINIIIELIGSHIHIHNIEIISRILERYNKFKKQLEQSFTKCGITTFPVDEKDTDFFTNPTIKKYDSTLNCQPIRNFVVEIISLIALSHQKEIQCPIINSKDVTQNYLYTAAKSFKIGGRNLSRSILKNELQIALQIIKRYLMDKIPNTEKAIFWILWLSKFENKLKRKSESFSCKSLKIDGIHKKETNHWVWYIWRHIFSRVSFLSTSKKENIVNIYKLFKINFSKKLINDRMPLLFFAIRVMNYESPRSFPSIMNNLTLHIQVYSNVNVLYKNLQIKLARKSWVDVTGKTLLYDTEKKSNPVRKKPVKKLTKKEKKEIERKQTISSLNKKTAYLDIIPKANNFF